MSIEVVGPLAKAEGSVVGVERCLMVLYRLNVLELAKVVVDVSDYLKAMFEGCCHTSSADCIDTIRL